MEALRLVTRALGPLALTAVPAAAAGEVQVLVGPPSGFGQVWSAAALDGSASPVPELASIRLLPLDASGRTQSEEFLPGRARVRFDVAGASRLALPAGRGALYRFERAAAPEASSSFGFLLVEPDGPARVLHERAGAGPAGASDPWLATVAVRSDGARFLAATTLEAGGDLVEIGLDASAIVRTAALAPQSWVDHGLMLTATWGSAATAIGVWRFQLASDAQAEPVALPGAPPWCAAELVASGDGLRAAVVAGTSAQSANVYVFGAAGAAARVPGAPQWITPAGFAPQHVGGPYLALSNDGAQAAWCTDGLSWEAWIADVLPTSPPPSQLSADGVFLDTLDGVGPFWFRADGRLQFAIGEKADPLVGGVEGLDVYEAFLPVGGAPLIANLTQTNGSAAPPYLQKSTIDPNFLRRVPGSDELLLQGRVGQQDVLARLGSAGVQPLILDVKKTQAVEYSGTAFLLGLESGAGAQPTLVVSLATSGAGAWIPGIVAALPTGTVVERTATNGLGTVAAVIDWLADEWVAAIDASTGAAALLFQFPLTYGPALDLGSTGGVALSTGPIGAPALSGTWTPGGSALAFQTPFAACQVLPGR